MRLRTLPLSLACIGMGSILAYADGDFRWDIMVMSFVTTIFLQLLSNVANDYGDAVSGVDGKDRKGPSRAVQAGKITKKAMLNAVYIFAVLSLLSGLFLVYLGVGLSWKFGLFLVLGLLAIAAAITYTMGKKPYGYAGLGDISVFIFFGVIGVIGTYFLHAQHFHWLTVLPAISCSFFAVAVLNINNIRDIESDFANGKISIPVRLGRDNAVIYHYILLILGILSSTLYVFVNYKGPWQFLFLLVVPLLIKNAYSVRTKKEASLLDPCLKQMALTTLLFVVCFGLGLFLELH